MSCLILGSKLFVTQHWVSFLIIIKALCDLFAPQKGADKPKYEEITIPTKLRKWAHSISNVEGFLLLGQDMCNRFSFELAKGMRKKLPMLPFVPAELRKKPWIPSRDERPRALEAWKVLQKPHKRHSGLELRFQSRHSVHTSRRLIIRLGDIRRPCRATNAHRHSP